MENPIRVMLVDDDLSIQQRMTDLLNEYDDFKIWGRAGSVQEARKLLAQCAFKKTGEEPAPEVIFLDVELGDADGFSLAAYVKETLPRVEMVFVTGHVEYAIRGYDYESLDYLVKPIDRDRFTRTLQRIRKKVATAREHSAETEEISLETANGLVVLSVRDILYLELRARKIYAVKRDGEEICVNSTIHKMEKLLKPYGFAKIYQSVIVQLAEVGQVEKEARGQTYHVILKTDHVMLPASRRFYYEMIENRRSMF